MSLTTELEKLHDLHSKGILSAEEYAKAKEKLLAGNIGNTGTTGSFFAGIAAKRFVNFIIGFSVFLIVAYLLFYFLIVIPAEKLAEENFRAFQEKNDKEFKEFSDKADKDMEAFRKKHGFK